MGLLALLVLVLAADRLLCTASPAALAGAARAWRRLRPAALAFARSAPVSVVYLFVLLVTTWVVQTSGPRLVDRLLLEHSTNLDHLASDPVRVLVASAFWLSRTWQLWVVVAGLAVIVAPLERRIGSLRTVMVLGSAHVGATLIVAAGLWLALRTGWVGPGVAAARDVGPSYALFGAAGCLAYLLERRLRGPYVAGLLAYAVTGISVGPSFTAVGHFVSIAVGLSWYRVARGASAGLEPVGTAPLRRLRRPWTTRGGRRGASSRRA